ncbi:MAG: pterin-4-alpha-carbinolamine dehydratase [Thermoleophilia bacterium]|nr:pterin-4-alpha-carbinolamine dehydratase [Thermoleophilia bacterium]
MRTRRSHGTRALASGRKTSSRTSSRPARRSGNGRSLGAGGFSVEMLIPLPTIVDTGVLAADVWSEVDSALERTFQFDDFVSALAFVNRVGELAEVENHHPDIAIHYNRVTLRWWTHTAGGITDRDRDLAERTNRLR